MFTTASQTRDEVIAAYNLAFQMSRMPQNLAQRYQSAFSQWTNLSAPNRYGNTSAWVDALNLGGPSRAATAYGDAVISLESADPSARAPRGNDNRSDFSQHIGC